MTATVVMTSAALIKKKRGPVFGPPTHEDAMIEDIHERRARVLEELNDRLQDAYNHGPEELA